MAAWKERGPTTYRSGLDRLLARSSAGYDTDAIEKVSLRSGESMAGLRDQLLKQIREMASGRRRSRNELMGSRQIAIFKDGVTL